MQSPTARNARAVILFGIAVAAACFTTGDESGVLLLAAVFVHVGFVFSLTDYTQRYTACGKIRHRATDFFVFLVAAFATLSLSTALVQEFAIPGVVFAFVATAGALQEDCEDDSVYPTIQ